MHTDKDSGELGLDEFNGASEEQPEENLGWLLDLDRSEPEEKLFALDSEEYLEEGLSEYEAELAARPLSRGNKGGDDLSSFVAEEIVVSSEGSQGGIYSESRGDAAEQATAAPAGGIKAIEHGRRPGQGFEAPAAKVRDGSDILGLSEDDDIGEKFLSLKRVKASPAQRVEQSPAAAELPAQEETPTVAPGVAADDVLGDIEFDLGELDLSATDEADAVSAIADVEEEIELDLGELDLGGMGEDDAMLAADDVLGDIEFDLGELDLGGTDDADALPAALDATDEIGLDLGELDLGTIDEAAALPAAEDVAEEIQLALDELNLGGIEEPDALSAADELHDDMGFDLGELDSLSSDADSAPSASDDLLSEIESELGDLSFDAGTPLAAQAPGEELLIDTESQGSLLGDVDLEWDDIESEIPLESSLDDQDFADLSEDNSLELLEMLASEEAGQADDGQQAYDPISLDTLLEMDEEAAGESTAESHVSEEESAQVVYLSEAPVPGQVAEPGAENGANEHSAQGEAQDGLSASDDEGDSNVLEYVASHDAPVDDDAFDKYLLRGAHLVDATEIDGLEVEGIEGVASVDPSPDANIDYHEDFRSMEGFGDSAISAITPVISEVMEEISGLAQARMAQLGKSADAIEVDVMLGSDEVSIGQCQAEGYEPVAGICPELPVALRELDDAAVETIYVRLFNGQTNENLNGLFQPEQEPASEDLSAATSENVALEVVQTDPEAELHSADSVVDAFAEDVFGEDVFDDEFLSELGSEQDMGESQGSSMDIDAAFGSFDDSLEQNVIGQDDAAPAAESEAEAESVADLDAGFGEDIFAGELSGDLPEIAADSAQDIDTVFAGLATGDADNDAICGLDVDEFDEADDLPALDGAGQFDEPGSAIAAQQDSSDLGWCIPQGIKFSYTSESGNEVFADFLDAFIEEGAATVEKLEDAIGEWERDIASDAAFAPVARLLHTLKGIAKGVGLQRYGTLIHNFETLLEQLPRPEAGADADYFRIVNAWLDASVRGLEFVRENRVDIDSELPGQVADSGAAPAEAGSQMGEDSPRPDDAEAGFSVSGRGAARQKKRDQQLADEGAKALAAQQSVRITSEKLDYLMNLTNQAQQLGVRSAQSTNRNKRASAELQGRLSSVRSHIGKIADRALLNVTATGGQQLSSEMDALEMDQYSELQEAASILSEAVEDLSDLVDLSSRHNAVLEALLKQQATVISTIGSSIQAARVVPVSRLMPGLRRIVRTVSADLDKSVAFKVLNETGALDRDHYARCQVVLEHMVRNALDHGIESPEERLAAGKATTGRISIDVRKSGGDYFITLADDGRGIDPYEMRESAFRKGLDIDVDALSDEEAIDLIFHKGFSTAAEVSEISGRGVGMDIVMNELQQVGGGVKVHSRVGQGTTFEVHIPAHVTVNGALFVTAGMSSYAIPLNGLIAVEQVPVKDFYNAVERGTSLPLFDMDCEPAYLATLCQGVGLPDKESWGDSVPVIIAGSEKRYMAIAIDNLEEALELVIRSLGAQFANVPGVAGAATTADGEAIVALDLNLLVESVSTGDLSPLSLERSEDNTMLALVVDDSRTQRMVTTSQFDTVGVETITAENGQVAIDLLNTTHRLPDVVLLDVEMPVKDGIETLREIRKSVRYKHLPVIMVTSRTGAKHRSLAEEAGCNGYMGKPFNFPALVKQINELTGYELAIS